VKNRVVMIVNPILTPTQMLQEILLQLDIKCESKNRQFLVAALHKQLLKWYEHGARVVLIVDEAHLIRNSATLEELRLLLNCQMNDQFLINLILLGQIELREKIHKVPALEQRLAVRQHLKPLNALETGEMIQHRLCVAGFSGEYSPFAPDAIFEMHKYTKGAPRLVSQIADNALMMAFARRQQSVDGFLIHEIIGEHAGVEVAA